MWIKTKKKLVATNKENIIGIISSKRSDSIERSKTRRSRRRRGSSSSSSRSRQTTAEPANPNRNQRMRGKLTDAIIIGLLVVEGYIHGVATSMTVCIGGVSYSVRPVAKPSWLLTWLSSLWRHNNNIHSSQQLTYCSVAWCLANGIDFAFLDVATGTVVQQAWCPVPREFLGPRQSVSTNERMMLSRTILAGSWFKSRSIGSFITTPCHFIWIAIQMTGCIPRLDDCFPKCNWHEYHLIVANISTNL